MAQQPANVLRAINAMLEARQDKRRDDLSFALEQRKLNQQESQFERELSIKQQSMELAEEQFAMQKEQSFLNTITAIKQNILPQRNSQYNTGWNAYFEPMISQFIDEVDDNGLVTKWVGEKNGSNDLIKALSGTFGNTQQAQKIFSQMVAYKNSGGKDTDTLISLVDNYEQYLGAPLQDFEQAKDLRIQLALLDKEQRDIQIGDYDFNELKDYYSELELAELERLRLKKEQELLQKEKKEKEKDLLNQTPIDDIDWKTKSRAEIESFLTTKDLAGNITELEGEARLAALSKILQDESDSVVDWNSTDPLFQLNTEKYPELVTYKINPTDTSNQKQTKYNKQINALQNEIDLNEDAIENIDKALKAGFETERQEKNYKFAETDEYETLQRNKVLMGYENEALEHSIDHLEDKSLDYRAETRGSTVTSGLEGLSAFVDYFRPIDSSKSEARVYDPRVDGFRVFDAPDYITLKDGTRVPKEDAEPIMGRSLFGDIRYPFRKMGDYFDRFYTDISEYEDIKID